MSHTEDVLAILALQSDYARGADSFDGATYAAVFTPDGWRISRRVLVELLPTVLEGYEVPNA